MRINHNIQALNAYSKLSKNQFATGKALERLSSGLRINRAADDAAGLAISEKMRGQIRGLQQAEKNAMDGISLIQTAEGALAEVHDMLSRMRELCVQGANGTLTPSDRKVIQDEIDQLRQQVDRVGNDTQFNTKNLLNGSLSENADTRSLYGTINYTKKGAGLREVAVDPASVLPQDVYSLNVVTTSKVVKTTEVNGTKDPYKTGMENILLSPDSLLGEGDYKISLKSKPQFAAAQYTNASELDANASAIPTGKYVMEYDAKTQLASLYELDKNGAKGTNPIDKKQVAVPAEPNDTKPMTVTFDGSPKTAVSFTLMNPKQDAKVEFEKSISTAPAPLDMKNIKELDTTGAAGLANDIYTIKYDASGATGVATLYKSSDLSTPIAKVDSITKSGEQSVTFGNGVTLTIKDASLAINMAFEKYGVYPGKVTASLTSAEANAKNMNVPHIDQTKAVPGDYTFTYTPTGGSSAAMAAGDLATDHIKVEVGTGSALPTGSHEITITPDDHPDFTPKVAEVTYTPALTSPSNSKGIFVGDTITVDGTNDATSTDQVWTLTYNKTTEIFTLKNSDTSKIAVIDDFTFGDLPYDEHGLSFDMDKDKFSAADLTSITFTTKSSTTEVSTVGEGYSGTGIAVNKGTSNPAAIEITSEVAKADWEIKYEGGKFKVTNSNGVNDEVAPGQEYNAHGIKFNMELPTSTPPAAMADGDTITLSTNPTAVVALSTDGGPATTYTVEANKTTEMMTGVTLTTDKSFKDVTSPLAFTTALDPNTVTGKATLSDAEGTEIVKNISASATATSPTAIDFGNGITIDVLAATAPVSATAFSVAYPTVSMSAQQLSKSVLEDGNYLIESDGVSAWLYEVDENGEKISPNAIDKIDKVGAGDNTFENKKVSFSGQVGRIAFKQTTEYEMGVYKGNQDVNDAAVEPLAFKKGVHFGEEALDFRDKDGRSIGLTIDFTNAANGYVKRGGALPETPAKGLPFYQFDVNNLKRTSVILKDSTQKVIAHQFVDNDRKFIELGSTGISFSTGILSHNEAAANLDIRRTLENASVTFQIGTNSGEIVQLGIGDIRTKALGIDKFKLTDETSSSNAIAIVDGAIDKISEVRSKLGAYQNRMEHTVNNITQSTENLTAAESRIRDADMAREMTEFTKLNIINQSATAMLAQANQLPQGILQLLKG